MTAFQLAHEREHAAVAAALHASDLESRVNCRFGLCERPDDPAVRSLVHRLAARKRHAIAAAEDASLHLDELWDRVSRALPPQSSSYVDHASLHEIEPEDFWCDISGTGAAS